MGKNSLHTPGMLDSDDDFGAAYESYAQPIYQFFYWRTRDSELAQDLTSGVFERAWSHRRNFSSGSVQAWLYKIAHNLLIDHWRTKTNLSLDNVDELVSDREDVSEVVDKQLLAQRLQAAMQTLSVEMHAVVQLRFIQNLSARQVGQLLGLSEGNVRVLQYRALKKMRKHLHENR